MKKGLKIGLITGASLLVAGGARAGLTKIGVIPNWFEIEALCSCLDCNGRTYSTHSNPMFNGKDCCEGTYQTCENCSGQVFNEGDYPQINGKDCCEGTYQTCENCNGQVFNEGDYPQINGKDCCEGTYGTKQCFTDGSFSGYITTMPRSREDMDRKPIIYLYPIKETEVHVKLGTPENLSHTYPKYNFEKGWNVIAQPNGDLEDMDTGRKLYALYREGKSDNETNFDEGFVVEGKDIIPFLEEKLATLGLNEREAEEFIVYWLTQMEDNKYNLIRFESIEEQNENMPLIITPTPDTVIRVMMDWKVIDEPIDIPEQQLTTPERIGFTVVEWGGSFRN